MSAFSNWNGPGCSQPNLPQVTTLEGLISQLRLVEQRALNIGQALEAHEKAVLTGLHQPIQDDYSTRINALRNEIGSIASSSGRIIECLNEARRYTDQIIGGSLPQGSVKATTDALAVTIANLASTLQSTDNRLTQTINSNQAALGQTLQQMLQETTTTTLNVLQIYALVPQLPIQIKGDIQQLGDLILNGKLTLYDSIDFVKWSSVNVQAVPDGSTTDNVVQLLGCLSNTWDPVGTFPPQQTHKSATIYIKFVNSKPWNAIIHATVTIDRNASFETRYTGALFVVACKTVDRATPISFGLYRDTVAGGEERIYVGIKTEDTVGHVAVGQIISGLVYNVAGINFEALTPALRANSSVKEIALTTLVGAAGVMADPIASKTVYTDNYLDARGNGVAVTDHDKDTLTIGNDGSSDDQAGQVTPRHLIIYSKDRPDVIVDGVFERMAFLSDLVSSIKWQRAVRVIVNTLDEVNALEVSLKDNGTIAQWDPAGNNVPGMYINNKHTLGAQGFIFYEGDVALVKNSGEQSIPLADGLFNGNFADIDPVLGRITIDPTQVQGLDVNHLKESATPNSETIVDGTVLIDATGVYAKIVTVRPGAYDLVTIISQPVTYTKPAYAKFNGTEWVLTDLIEIPGTDQKHISTLSYQWSGFHLDAHADEDPLDYYVNAYVVWTPSYENETTMSYTNEQELWSFTDLPLAGYRLSDAQDEIDTRLEVLGAVQPDYAEAQQYIPSPYSGNIIPNPAFIQNKPWTGQSLADGGNFNSTEWNGVWLLDGGDVTGLWRPNFVSPVAVQGQQFRNSIIKLWRGIYNDMIEKYDHATDTWTAPQWAWNIYAFNPRFVTDTKEFMISDGDNRVLRYIPWDNYKAQTEAVMQSVVSASVPDTLTITFETTDFSAALNPTLVIRTLRLIADNDTLAFENNANDTTITSPRMDAIEDAASTLEDRVTTVEAHTNDVDTRLTAIEPLVTDTDSRLTTIESNVSSLQATSTNHGTRIGTLETDVSELQTTVAGIVADVDYEAGEQLTTQKWFDNRPIYQKSILGMLGTSGNEIIDPTLTVTNSQIIFAEGTINSSAGNQFVLPYSSPASDTMCYVYGTPTGITMAYSTAFYGQQYVATYRYVKNP